MDERSKNAALLACPAPLPGGDTVLLGHGSGGRLTSELIRELFLPAFDNPALARLDDQAIVSVNGCRLAFTTDSFVVKPVFFPGGDIGSLAVHGTVNDLAMGGARPLFLSAAFIIEEGFSMQELRCIVDSFHNAAQEAGIEVVTGDTKVVERGSGDGLFINTSGIGLVPPGLSLSANQARPGDRVLLSGPIGDHGMAIMAQREGLEFESTIRSDSAALYGLVAEMLKATGGIRCMRDPTRGGLASALNEIAGQSQVGIELEEESIPVHEQVRSACEILGLDPMYVANEGKLIAIVSSNAENNVLQAMRGHPQGREARVIGTVREEHPGLVTMRTALGTTRIVDMLAGDQLPRIC
ncbi:MAG TPA: hydrogenase expression/formation protein HypE [Terriglobales bacterium]|nr:hydrogenase expression/formation protein HypE [Terriglobales bacterium]